MQLSCMPTAVLRLNQTDPEHGIHTGDYLLIQLGHLTDQYVIRRVLSHREFAEILRTNDFQLIACPCACACVDEDASAAPPPGPDRRPAAQPRGFPLKAG